ncbi:unnamed protein product [Closterium sp. Naga37s-1]|nr:unnamed protein product [Closterium sp. Naga37s-1]
MSKPNGCCVLTARACLRVFPSLRARRLQIDGHEGGPPYAVSNDRCAPPVPVSSLAPLPPLFPVHPFPTLSLSPLFYLSLAVIAISFSSSLPAPPVHALPILGLRTCVPHLPTRLAPLAAPPPPPPATTTNSSCRHCPPPSAPPSSLCSLS